MKNLKNSIYLLILAMVVMFGCKKEGPAGPAGQNGTNGNANLVMTPYTKSWTEFPLTFPRNIVDIAVPSITQEMITDGLIIGYMSTDNRTWHQLPYFLSIGTDNQVNFRPYIEKSNTGHFYVEVKLNNGGSITNISQLNGSTTLFKVFTISK